MNKTFKNAFLHEFFKRLLLTLLALWLILTTSTMFIISDRITVTEITLILTVNALNIIGLIAFSTYKTIKPKV